LHLDVVRAGAVKADSYQHGQNSRQYSLAVEDETLGAGHQRKETLGVG